LVNNLLLNALHNAATTAATSSGFDPSQLLFPVLLVFLVFTMWNGGRKRRRAAANLKSSLAVGAHVVLISGITGAIVSLDDSIAVIETTPGTQLRVLVGAIRGIDTTVAQPESATQISENSSDDKN
jgi:preprotein translocase YajC subunit